MASMTHATTVKQLKANIAELKISPAKRGVISLEQPCCSPSCRLLLRHHSCKPPTSCVFVLYAKKMQFRKRWTLRKTRGMQGRTEAEGVQGATTHTHTYT